MGERVKSRELPGEKTAWDPQDPGPFAAVAGSQFVRADGDCAVVRTGSGDEMTVPPGWLAIGLDAGGVLFSSPDNYGDDPGLLWGPEA